MLKTDLIFIFEWWFVLFTIGIVFIPICLFIFSSFKDKGYIFSKILGFGILSYIAFIIGVLHLFEFSRTELIFILTVCFIVLTFFWKKIKLIPWRWIIFEEIIFFLGLYTWSFIRSASPDIHGLEKYMDFGFINSILRSKYFPPIDMWYPPYPINYYYFGHLTTGVLTKIANIPSEITFNLMVATIFSFTFTGTFSIAINLLSALFKSETISNDKHINNQSKKRFKHSNFSILNLFRYLKFDIRIFLGGLLTAFLATFAGNLHTIYTFFKPYPNENPVPPWKLVFSLFTFPNQYWYPNATRFIYHTIHEFPIYSFVVSDLHGHVLDIPFVLLIIAVLLSLIFKYEKSVTPLKSEVKTENKPTTLNIQYLLLVGFLLALMYMTNAWDGMIYFLLSTIVLIFINLRNFKSTQENNRQKSKEKYKSYILHTIYYVLLIFVSFLLFSFPFSHYFNTSQIVHGIGVLCSPKILTSIGKVGPFLFEADHCQKSPWWQILILYGFFYFWAGIFIIFLLKQKDRYGSELRASSIKHKKILWLENISSADIFIILLISVSTLLIIIPEFFYLKDIYPAHYRANTMFKLVYQSFIMLSICSGYIIIRIIAYLKYSISNSKHAIWKLIIVMLFGSIGLFLVGIYPYFSIMSYYGNLQTYNGLNGTSYLEKQYKNDAKAITWINKNITGRPVILEAQGDSYTDYARVSSNTGLPTVLGWTVHEWLWRGSYDPLPERFNDVSHLYETSDVSLAKQIILKYNIQYIFIGSLERQKYTNLYENKFLQLGSKIFQSGQTSIYRVKLY